MTTRCRNLLKLRIFGLLFLSILILFFLRPYPRLHLTKTIQFERQNEDFGDQLFSLFSQLGVAKTVGRVPVLNVFNNSEFVDRLSRLSTTFPMVLEQFSIVVEPNKQPNAELCCSFDDPEEKLSDYTTLDMMVRGNGFKSFKYFDHLRPEIRQWMLGNAENVEKARNLLAEEHQPKWNLCVHGSDETDTRFAILAMEKLLEVYSKKFKFIAVFMWGIEEEIGQSILYHDKLSGFPIDRNYMSDLSAESQLAFSRLFCDAVLLTDPFAAIGWWIGYLAKDESPVFYADLRKPSDSSLEYPLGKDYFLPEWKRMFLVD